MCDLFLVLAQAPAGLTCFLLPRVLPDGTRNAMLIQRLKDKLGNRSNASAEVEFDAALAWQVGAAGRGVPTIIEMVSATRLDCVLGSAAAMRQGCVAAVHHASWRQAFGKDLISQPLMAAVLADLVVESEAATTLAVRLAGAAERAARGDAQEAALLRAGTARRQVLGLQARAAHTAEALECLGGNGYIEESGLPRLYREAPLNSIWEGSGNVTALDVLRALARAAARRHGACRRPARRARPGLGRRPQTGPGLRPPAPPAARSWPPRPGQTRSTPPGGSPGRSRSPSRPRCWSGTRPRRWRTPSALHGWAGLAGSGSLGWGTLSGPGVPFGTLPGDVATGAILDRAAAASR